MCVCGMCGVYVYVWAECVVCMCVCVWCVHVYCVVPVCLERLLCMLCVCVCVVCACVWYVHRAVWCAYACMFCAYVHVCGVCMVCVCVCLCTCVCVCVCGVGLGTESNSELLPGPLPGSLAKPCTQHPSASLCRLFLLSRLSSPERRATDGLQQAPSEGQDAPPQHRRGKLWGAAGRACPRAVSRLCAGAHSPAGPCRRPEGWDVCRWHCLGSSASVSQK